MNQYISPSSEPLDRTEEMYESLQSPRKSLEKNILKSYGKIFITLFIETKLCKRRITMQCVCVGVYRPSVKYYLKHYRPSCVFICPRDFFNFIISFRTYTVV